MSTHAEERLGTPDCIVLAGFMGTGKTVVGARVAGLIGAAHVDLDAEIVSAHGPVSDIFEREGQERFRQIEHAALSDVLDRDGRMVISLGGGTLTHPASRDLLAGRPGCFSLSADIDDVMVRTGGSDSRPLLSQPLDRRAAAEQLLRDRQPQYDMFESVQTSGRTPSEVASDVIRRAKLVRVHESA